MNQKLGSTAKEEIRSAMQGLVGPAARAEAERLAEIHSVTWQSIYRMTQDMRQGLRKRRSDSGKRQFELREGTDVWEAAALVIGAKLDPDQALLTARANGHTDLPSLAHFQKLLAEKQLNGKQRKYGRRTHREFRAAAPLDLVQIDCTALKVRWHDTKTRRITKIEGIDKNHPQLDTSIVRVWQILAVDDHTRRFFLRYVTTQTHITSADMVRFLSELAAAWGIPKRFYTDNGSEFKGFFSKAIKIIASIPSIAETGGCEHIKHWPGNAQGTGKVENGHKWAEKMDKYVGLAIQKGLEVTLDKLNDFADAICRNKNEVKVHSKTGQTPVDCWFSTKTVIRTLPASILQTSLLFDSVERRLTAAMTVRVGKVDYRIPTVDKKGNASPFKIGMMLQVVVPHEIDNIFVTTPDGVEYVVEKTLAEPIAAGVIEPRIQDEAEILTKKLKTHHRRKNSEAISLKDATGEVYQVPHYNHEVEVPATNVHHFPHREIAIPEHEIAAATPVPLDAVAATTEISKAAATSKTAPAYTGKPVDFWDAMELVRHRFSSIAEMKSVLESLFPDQQGTALVAEVEAVVDHYFNPQQEVAPLRLTG